MESKIKLELGSVFNGEGFRQAQRAVDSTAKSVQKAAGGMGAIGGELGKIDGKIGAVAGGVSHLLGSLSAGPWGLAAAAVGLVVSAFVKWRSSVEEARKAHEELMSKMEEGYKRRIAGYVEKARKAEIEALDAIISKGKRAVDVINARAAAYKNLSTSESALARAGDRVALAAAGEDEQQQLLIKNTAATREADRAVYEAEAEVHRIAQKMDALRKVVEAQQQKGEDSTRASDDLTAAGYALAAARNALAAAEANRTATEIENDNREQELGRKQAKAEQDRIDELEKANNRTRNQARIDALSTSIEKARRDKDGWEEKAKGARGVTFRDWIKAEKDKADKAAADKAAFEKANRADELRAKRARDRFDAGRVVSKRELAFMRQFETWKAAQDPANNPAAKTLEELEREKAATTKNLDKSVDEIREFLKKATTPES